MTTKLTKRGRWKAGESGNPKGRPPGLGEVSRLRQGIAEHLPEIIQTLVLQAKGGDCQAARLLLERVLPPMKPTEQTVTLPLPDGDLPAQGMAILQAVAAGELAPGQAAALLGALGSLAKLDAPDPVPPPIEIFISFASPGNVIDAE